MCTRSGPAGRETDSRRIRSRLRDHYTPNGKSAEEDLTKVGFVLAKAASGTSAAYSARGEYGFAIPPATRTTRVTPMPPSTSRWSWCIATPYASSRERHGCSLDLSHRRIRACWSASRISISAGRWCITKTSLFQCPRARALNSAPTGIIPPTTATTPIRRDRPLWGDQTWDEMIFAWVGVIADRDDTPETVMAVRRGNSANASPNP